MFFWTETPTIEMWNQIKYLKSPKNIENILNGNTNCNRERIHFNPIDVDKRSYEIASCIRQADEYYTAAESVGLATQPLLQFYGAQSLAKAVILANNNSIGLIDLKYHGLSTRPNTATAHDEKFRADLQNYSDNPRQWKIENEFAISNNGVFPKLCESICETVPDTGICFKFKELIRVLPDLSEMYQRHYNESSHCFYLYRENLPHEVKFSPNVDLEDVKQVFPEFKQNYKEFLSSPRDNTPGFVNPTLPISDDSFAVEEGIAGNYLIKPLDCGIHKSFSLIFATLFILSNVVRYKPSFWMKELEGRNSGSASIVEFLCNLSKRILPNDALESIWWEKFEYGTPIRLP